MAKDRANTDSATELAPQTILAQGAAKLHSEVNQYINHLFVITMTAITVFGLIGGWIISGLPISTPTAANPQVSVMTFLISTLLVLVLLVLFYASQVTANNVLVLATYLRVTRISRWEQHMDNFRSAGRPWFTDQKESRFLLFGVLGAVSFGLPFLLMGLFDHQAGTAYGVALGIHVVCGVFFFAVLLATSCGILFRFPNEVEETWRKLTLPHTDTTG
jgi:hypothetical protein